MKKIDLYYFTGTGNTLLVAKKIKEVFDSKGLSTQLFAIEKSKPQDVDLSKTIGLAFPVAVFSTYSFVMDFIKSLPVANGTKVFMIDTMGGSSLGIRGGLKSILESKGYVPYACQQFVMPDNFWPTKEKALKNSGIISDGLKSAEKFANDFIAGNVSWKGFPVLSSLLCSISQMIMKTKSFRTSIKLDKHKCIKCGQCAKLCPVNNITMEEYPVLHGNCCLCVRCTSFCPTTAIYRKRKGGSREVYRGVSPNELL